ncbi:MAG: DUF1956 domain-containing protein [Phycisphaerales bacterium]|nr:MAG: DUF1956 domain-containing protein [Phycisphaerales bacterium]
MNETCPERDGTSARESLLAAAVELFSSRGYAAVGIREIADRAGANLASINYYFGSKRGLYLATVRTSMVNQDGRNAWDLLEHIPDGPDDAAILLARFVREWLDQLIPVVGGNACASLIVREGLHPTEAIDAVVDDYLKPNECRLRRLLAVFLPEADELELGLHAHSLLGQVLHYCIYRPIVERLRGMPLRNATMSDAGVGHDLLDRITHHVTRTTLRSLGVHDARIDAVLKEIAPNSETVDSEAASDSRRVSDTSAEELMERE